MNGKLETQWISTTKCEATASGKYGREGYVKIDLSKVKSPVEDVSGGIPGASRRVNAYAKADQEVLIQDYIPASAIKRMK